MPWTTRRDFLPPIGLGDFNPGSWPPLTHAPLHTRPKIVCTWFLVSEPKRQDISEHFIEFIAPPGIALGASGYRNEFRKWFPKNGFGRHMIASGRILTAIATRPRRGSKLIALFPSCPGLTHRHH